MQKAIGSVDQSAEWLTASTLSVVEALEKAIAPLNSYLELFRSFEGGLLNLN